MKAEKKNVYKENIMFLIIIIAVIFFWVYAPIGTLLVKGVSMEPTLKHNDLCIINKRIYKHQRPEQGDIVACEEAESGSKEYLVKRVIGVPGDTVDFVFEGSNYVLYLNGEEYKEDYIAEEIMQKGDMEYPYKVPESSYFVMGDNRNLSMDSRFISVGVISEERIKGEVIMKIYPFKEIGRIE